jgi:hypothetical protein
MVQAVRLDVMKEKQPRRLHAKVFEVMCKRGRVLLSGSANVTRAALVGDRNIEACVLRVQREQTCSSPGDRSDDDRRRAFGVRCQSGRRTAYQRDELAARHSITSSARASSVGGTKEFARLTVVAKSLRGSRQYRKLAEMYWALALGEESNRARPSKTNVK